MKKDIQFRETQYFNQWWIWLLMIIINVPFIYGVIWQVFMNNTFGSNPMSNTGLIISGIIVLILSILLLTSHLTTVIDKHGVSIKFFPFNLNYKFFAWEDVLNCEIITFNPLLNYGGWGIRINKNGKAYIVKGNKGLQLDLKSRKKILIGTQQAGRLEEILKNADKSI